MGLSGDQKALLRLLAQREQGYEDVAALMGLSVEEVRARVKDALDAVEREGGTPPPAPAEKEEAPRETPRAKEPAPKAEAPKPPPPSRPEPPAPKVPNFPPPEKPRRSGANLPKERRVLAIAGGLGAIVLVIVLLATGVIGGGDSGDSSDSSSSGSGEETSQTASSELRSTEKALADSNLTGAVLRSVDGGDGSGAALFGKEGKQILLQVEATGLEPSPQGSSYAIWLYKSPELALRVGAVELGEDEEGIRVQLPLPEEALGTVAAGLFDQISLSLTDNAEYKAAVAKAKSGQAFPPYTGTEVLRGPIQGPIAEVAAEAQQQTGKAKSGN